MRNYIILNGVNSNTITGLLISTLPPITKTKIRTQIEEIDGRDGDIVTKLGYSSYDKIIEIGLYGNFDINEVISYFSTEGTVVFSNEADKYYNYQILDQIDYEKLIRFKTAKVKMHVQPFKYPLQEEQIQVDATVVQASGTDIKLEYTTPNASIETEVEGKSEQEGTPSPDTPQEIKSVSGIENLFDNDILLNATDWIKNEDGYYTGTALNLFNYIRNNPITGFKENTQYTISNKSYSSISNSGGRLTVTYTDDTTSECYIGSKTTETYYSLTTTANKTISNITFTYSNGHTLYIKYIQIEESTIAHTPVPYGHWLPVKVSNKNLLNSTLVSNSGSGLTWTVNEDKSVTINGTNISGATRFIRIAPNFTLPAGTYTLSNGNTNVSNNTFIFYDDKGRFPKTNISTVTFTQNTEIAPYIKITAGTTVNNETIYPMIEQNSTATEYIEHQEQTTLIDLNKNNLFGDTWEEGSIATATGQNVENTNYKRTIGYTDVKSNAIYTFDINQVESQIVIFYYNDTTFLSFSNLENTNSITFKTPSNCTKIRAIVLTTNSISNTQLFEGTTPYYELCSIGNKKDLLTIKDGKAILNKNINKVILNGSENWGSRSQVSGDYYRYENLDFRSNDCLIHSEYISDKFTYTTDQSLIGNYIENTTTSGANRLWVVINTSLMDGNTIENFKTWLSTHNAELYYALETPEEIELNGDYNIKAYDQVTYMTTEGNLIPVINAKTNGMPNTIVTNIGNIYAKPLITIYGSGDIGVYLNNQHVLQIALGNNESITIDVSKMEAYDKNTKVLMNRLVTGDYMKFLINSGENEIAFSGTVAGFTMDNYTRWL